MDNCRAWEATQAHAQGIQAPGDKQQVGPEVGRPEIIEGEEVSCIFSKKSVTTVVMSIMTENTVPLIEQLAIVAKR